MDPLITSAAAHITAGRIAAEAIGAAGVSVLALSMTTQEVGIGITCLTLLVGLVAWSVRIQGAVQNLEAFCARMDRRVEKIADHLGVVE